MTEPSFDSINLVDFARNHEDMMNLHKKLRNLELQNHSSHITSKIDMVKELRSSFKPPEVIKLKALRELDEKMKNYENYDKFKAKKIAKIMEIPKISQRKINEKVEINKILAKLNEKLEKIHKGKSLVFCDNSSYELEKILEIQTKRNENPEKNPMKSKIMHQKGNSLMNLNKDLLPLKYNVEKYEKKSSNHIFRK